MSDIAIRVENLSKQYRIGAKQEKYKTLRDTLAGAVQGPARALQALTGRRECDEAQSFWALKDVSFEVKRGEVVGIIGRNGAGKSTLLKILSRITEPTSGHAELRGRVASLLEVGTGFHPELTGRENIFLNGAILGMRREEIARKFDEIVAFAEVEQFVDTPVKHYSSGMYLRLAFAVAAHLEPEILVVDEVLAVGDAQFQKKCLGKMGEVAKEGRTVLFVSHNMGAIENLCGKAYWLNQGQCVWSGRTNEVIEKYLRENADQTAVDIGTRRDRKGDGRLRFTDIGFLDGAGLTKIVKCGTESPLAICYESAKEMRNIHVSVGFFSMMGEKVLYLSNEMTGYDIEVPSGRGRFLCWFERMPLLPGLYRVNIHCTVNGALADWVVDAAQVTVEDGNYFRTGKLPPRGYGAIAVQQSWGLLEGIDATAK